MRINAVGIRRVRGGKDLLHRLRRFQNILRNFDLEQFPLDRLDEPNMEIDSQKSQKIKMAMSGRTIHHTSPHATKML